MFARFSTSCKQEVDEGYDIWRIQECKRTEEVNREAKSKQVKDKYETELQNLEKEQEATRPDREKEYRLQMREK